MSVSLTFRRKMSDGRTSLTEGARLLTEVGTAVAIAVLGSGVRLRDSVGNVTEIDWREIGSLRTITDGEVAAVIEALRPMWDALDTDARNVALMRLEVVQEIVTGYRDGHPELARPGEPRPPFGPGFGVSETKRCTVMAEILSREGEFDRLRQRRLRDGEIQSVGNSPSTVKSWLREWRKGGLVALVDGRSLRPSRGWDLIDERFREAATREFDALDGDRSTVSIDELHRRTLVSLKNEGITNLATPKRITQQFLSSLKHGRGATTRAQKTHKLHEVSGTKNYPAIRPGQVVAIDVTRADNLVFDALSGRPFSVEIITAIDVATRVVLAIRVVPRSANALEAGLLMYDVCRPFSLLVDGTRISDWRWVGLPEQLDLSRVSVKADRRIIIPDFSTLQGEHAIPSIRPDAAHCDNGSIFVSTADREVLKSLGIDLLLSRKGKPTDNPHVERWHETIQRGLQQIPGYKGRNVSERGRLVADEALLTAQELQIHLRRFVALDYHREPHDGIILPNEEIARICPLEMWDSMVELTGRIDVPQHPDLIYQFLPIKWGTIDQAGVEFSNLTYDSTVLDPYRDKQKGRWRDRDAAAPFFVDPHDLSRIWFHDREQSGRIVPIEWRGSYRMQAPMTQAIVDIARRNVRNRGGNSVLKRGSAGKQILEELTQLTETPPTADMRSQLAAAARRVEQSRIDHDEAQRASDLAGPALPVADEPRSLASIRRKWPNLLKDR